MFGRKNALKMDSYTGLLNSELMKTPSPASSSIHMHLPCNKKEDKSSDGCEKLECRWGRKWFGNYCNLPRNSFTPFGNKKRLWKFRVKKQQFKHRQKKKRVKVAAIGNTPFNKKIRVQMTSRFDHINEHDVNAVANENREQDQSSGVQGKSESFVGKRAKSKYTS